MGRVICPKAKMFKNTFQSGFLSILYSIGSKPLQIWDKKVRNGHIKRITDNDIQSLVLEIEGTNVSTTYICAPADPKKTLGIKLSFLKYKYWMTKMFAVDSARQIIKVPRELSHLF